MALYTRGWFCIVCFDYVSKCLSQTNKQWLQKKEDCPVCKAGVNKDNVIPVYGKGRPQSDPRFIMMIDR